jgi:hypothetical protein
VEEIFVRSSRLHTWVFVYNSDLTPLAQFDNHEQAHSWLAERDFKRVKQIGPGVGGNYVRGLPVKN